MIIPPDPEKDPNIFRQSATPSIYGAPSEHSYFEGSAWDAESLPPYEGQRRSRLSVDNDLGTAPALAGSSSREGDVFSDENAAQQPQLETRDRGRRPGLGVVIPPEPTHSYRDRHSPTDSAGSLTPTAARASSSSLPSFHTHHGAVLLHGGSHISRSPSIVSTTRTTLPVASTSKLWESSASKEKHVLFAASPTFRRWWKRWRRWVQGAVVLVLIAVALVIGLLVGMRQAGVSKHGVSAAPWEDNDGTPRHVAIWGWNDPFNLTYTEARDGPSPTDGNLTNCNRFTPLKSSSAYSSLFTPFSATSVYMTTFNFPLQANASAPSDLFINARGLGSTGTITFVGSDGSDDLKNSAPEGNITVDVIVKYAGLQALDSMLKVCEMNRGEGGVGVGIYSPLQTDNKITDRSLLNPNYIPTTHIVIRVPASIYNQDAPFTYFPSLSFGLDYMHLSLGDLEGIAQFGELNLSNDSGGVSAGYVALQAGNIEAKGDIRGQWNVSEGIFVNVSSGNILADIILHDPSAASDNSTTLDSTDSDSDFAIVRRKSASASSKHRVNTGFCTVDGSLYVRYLHQPTTVALSSLVSTLHGHISLHLHPNFVGPFAAKTVWGEIRIPDPSPVPDYDPTWQGRHRAVSLGQITVQSNSSFARAGMNATVLQNSTNTITGAAYWADLVSTNQDWSAQSTGGDAVAGNSRRSEKRGDGKTTVRYKTVDEVQDQAGADGDEVVVLGAWGNVAMAFDGS
ncbi:hypothetical protein I350_05867 [Cryptococcus amylolentus CBS 6273]|uniref:Uncharacterized protein n=1 Tax=Cryptococcus amylolentus CBS 6273 TaxID=1296118 RepID=A0A1E3JQC3_9TREE|nr:hypothetical protein I350_05867 [Cryptococcus amylolentus CBS 6273]